MFFSEQFLYFHGNMQRRYPSRPAKKTKSTSLVENHRHLLPTFKWIPCVAIEWNFASGLETGQRFVKERHAQNH